MTRIKLLLFLILGLCTITTFSETSPANNPNFRSRAPYLISESVTNFQPEILFGRNLAARILAEYTIIDKTKLNDYIALIGTGIAAQFGFPELQYHFGILDTPMVNAYACPGGYIFITKGALNTMTNEAQLVGVLAHEIAHINRRHVVQKFNIRGDEEGLMGDLGAIIGGGTNTARAAMTQFVEEAVGLLFETGLGHQSELEADQDAIEMLIHLGYDPSSYINYIASLKTFYQSNGTHALSKTHPTVDTRISAIQETMTPLIASTKQKRTHEKRFKAHVNL